MSKASPLQKVNFGNLMRPVSNFVKTTGNTESRAN